MAARRWARFHGVCKREEAKPGYTPVNVGKMEAHNDIDYTAREFEGPGVPHQSPTTSVNGDGEWDDFNPPELAPAVFSCRMKAMMKKRQQKRRATKGTPSATASSSSSCSSASAPNKRPKRTSAKPINYASEDDDDDDDDDFDDDNDDDDDDDDNDDDDDDDFE
jgi:hypothetical protein